MRYSARDSILCFTKEELHRIFKVSKIGELLQEMVRRGTSFDDLRGNSALMHEITDTVGIRGAADRDEHEVFAALFSFSRFYDPNCEICFEVNRNFDPKNPQITDLADLNRYRQGINTSDFMIRCKDGLRKFELKRYRGTMDAENIFEFIREKIAHYANKLGDTNLLIQLQPIPYTAAHIEFREIHDRLQALDFDSQGEILISFNQNNETHVLVQVYPGISKHEIPIGFPSAQDGN